MHQVTGTFRYSPVRTGLKNLDQADTLVLDLPRDDLAEYYQWHIKKKYGQWLGLQSPMFGTHVSVIRPQEVDLKNPLWGKYEGQTLHIFYTVLERHWGFWSLNIVSPQLIEVRREFGLRTDYRLHITVGRQFDWQPKEVIPGVVHDVDYT